MTGARSTAPGLSRAAVDLTPGLIAVDATAARVGVRTTTCTSCGAEPATAHQRLALEIPAWFYVAGALFFGSAYYGAIGRLWTNGALDAANHVYRQSAWHHAILVAAPYAVPLVFLGLLAVLGFVLFRARGLSLPVCAECRRRERRARAAFAMAGPVGVVIAAFVLHPIATLPLPIVAVGVVLLPFAFARSVLRRLWPGVEGGVARARTGRGAWLVLVPAAAESVIRREAPSALALEGAPHAVYRWGFGLPILVALFLLLHGRGAMFTYTCPYGSVPMEWSEGSLKVTERHYGCMAPSGDRHGAWRIHVEGAPRSRATYRFDRVVEGTRARFIDGAWQPADG